MNMVIPFTVPELKKLKNSVIGNPTAKTELARDGFFVQNLIQCLPAEFPDDIRTEVAHVISSLSYGSQDTLDTLLCANALHAVLAALSDPTQLPPLRAALARALRSLASALADIAGPSQWGLRPEIPRSRFQAAQALDHVFHTESLDIYLPFLAAPSSVSRHTALATSASVAHLLASAIRFPVHRQAVVDWAPPATRHAHTYHHRVHRGWERDEGEKGGGWVVRALVDMVKGRDTKSQEAALWALASLAKDNVTVATALVRSTTEFPSTLPLIVSLAKARSPDVQLAACFCITNILRAAPGPSSSTYPFNVAHTLTHSHSLPGSTPLSTSSPHSLHHSHTDHTGMDPDTCARTVMSVVNRMIVDEYSATERNRTFVSDVTQSGLREETIEQREARRIAVKACFILYHLVSDDTSLCQAAYDRGCLENLVNLVQQLTPHLISSSSPSSTSTLTISPAAAEQSTLLSLDQPPPEDLPREPENVSLLREAALTSLASIALFDNDIRRALASSSFIPCILTTLTHPRPGLRYAACQCVRAVSRAVAVLRTSVVDSGLGMGVWGVLGREVDLVLLRRKSGKRLGNEDGDKEKDEVDGGDDSASGDTRVISAALAAVCNLVNEFSPLREVLLHAGLIPRLVQVLELGNETEMTDIRISALWAVKNLLCKTGTEMKVNVLGTLGSDRVIGLLEDTNTGVQEQALNVVRNLTENEEGIELVYAKMGPWVLLERVLGCMSSSNEDVVLQASCVLANLANGPQALHLLTQPRVLSALHTALVSTPPKTDIRRPVVACIAQLAQLAQMAHGSGRAAMKKVGFEEALKNVCEWGSIGGAGGGSSSVGGVVGGRGAGPLGVGMERDRDVVEQARIALHVLEFMD